MRNIDRNKFIEHSAMMAWESVRAFDEMTGVRTKKWESLSHDERKEVVSYVDEILEKGIHRFPQKHQVSVIAKNKDKKHDVSRDMLFVRCIETLSSVTSYYVSNEVVDDKD